MARKTKEEAQLTRTKILNAAERLFYERGVARTTLLDIAKAAGLTRGAIYWHFDDKGALLRAIAERDCLPSEVMLDTLASQDVDNPLLVLCQSCTHAVQDIIGIPSRRRVFTILMQRCEYLDDLHPIVEWNESIEKRIQERIQRIFIQIEAKGHLAPAWTADTAALALHRLLIGFIHLEMIHDDPSPERDAARRKTIIAFFAALAADINLIAPLMDSSSPALQQPMAS